MKFETVRLEGAYSDVVSLKRECRRFNHNDDYANKIS